MGGVDGGDYWRYWDDAPVVDWDDRIVLGSGAFSEWSDRRPAGPMRLRALLIGHSHDLDLARIATLLQDAGTAVEVLLVDRVGHQPTVEFPTSAPPARYDVGYCRGFRPAQVVHYHFDRTLRRASDWRAIDPALEGHVVGQVNALLWSWLRRVTVSRWVNSPWDLREAENKLIQLAAAEHVGLTIPATLVTDRTESVRRFSEKHAAGIVHKSLDSPVIALGDGKGRFLYTAAVEPDHLGELTFPGLFQQRLLPRREHRVTVIGNRRFVASLHRTPTQQPDWRRDAAEHHRFEHHALDDVLIDAIGELMATLGVQVGAVDLLETDDQIYFLELNPSAALTWLERTLGMQLCQTVTNLILCGR